MKKRSNTHRTGLTRDNPRAAVAAAARQLEKAISASDHSVSIFLDPVVALGEHQLPHRIPVADHVRRVVSDPVVNVRAIGMWCSWADDFRGVLGAVYPPGGLIEDEGAVDSHVQALANAIETFIGAVRVAAQVDTRPEGYYANKWTEIVLVSSTHIARLALTATD
ncbi:hypothetical protein [Nocardia sp. NPDC057668]|uniref:hypothetical protein n=1 Tax=Nocardia sp. NPDC057668 TaxID=3346202 RepID=UPI00366CD8E4